MFITTINNEIECRFQVETIDDMRTRAHTANAPTVLSFQSIVGESFRCQRDKATSDENDFVFFLFGWYRCATGSKSGRIHASIASHICHRPNKIRVLLTFVLIFFCVNVEWMIFAIQSNDAMKMSLLRTRPNSADCWCVNDYARQVKRKSFARLIRLSFMANVINWSLSSSSCSFIDAIRLTFSHTKSVSHPEISHSDSNFTLNRILCEWLSWVYVIWHSFCTVKINCNLFMNLFAHTFCKHSSMHT